MQKVKIPLNVDPIKAALQRLDYNGIVKKEELLRLNESTSSVKTDANVQLSFDVDKQGLKVLYGKADIEVELVCQRCMQPYVEHITAEFIYTPLFKLEKIEEIPESYEVIMVNSEGIIDLLQVIEDELILAMPPVARHDLEDCSVTESDMEYGEIPEEVQKPNPFAVLESLKK